MNRTVRAFLIAPLWVPLIAGVEAAVSGTRPQQMAKLTSLEWVGIVVAGHLVIGCLAAWTLGVAVHALLRARRITTLAAHVAAWFCAGLALRCLLVIAAWVPTGGIAMGVRELAEMSTTHPLFLLAGGVTGALLGATLWLLLRPDRAGPADHLPAKSI